MHLSVWGLVSPATLGSIQMLSPEKSTCCASEWESGLT